MPGPHRTRREWLAGLCVSLSGALAGCTTVITDDATPTPEPYDHLRTRRVYVAESLSLTLPAAVDAAASPEAADVVVLPATTDRPAETAVDWLAAGTLVVLLGSDAEDTYHAWKGSDPYADVFGEPEGYAESRAGGGSGSGADAAGEPPELVAAWATADGDRVTTYRATWGHTDDPSDGEVLAAIESALDDE